MSDYYTKFSFLLKLPNYEAWHYAIQTHQLMAAALEGDTLAFQDVQEELKPWIDDWYLECSSDDREKLNNEIWIRSENEGCPGTAAFFVQHLLKKFKMRTTVKFEYCHDANKPLLDTYGGGVCWVTAKAIDYMDTSNWTPPKTKVKSKRK